MYPFVLAQAELAFATAPTSIVQPGHIQQLTFGTCRFFFENFNTVPLEFCWQDLVSFPSHSRPQVLMNVTDVFGIDAQGNNGSAAAAACFPPVQPVNSLAECVAPSLSWEIGSVSATPVSTARLTSSYIAWAMREGPVSS